eukprot:scaffold170854_cov30-Prasinocladus_malaysianus.AAC.1
MAFTTTQLGRWLCACAVHIHGRAVSTAAYADSATSWLVYAAERLYSPAATSRLHYPSFVERTANIVKIATSASRYNVDHARLYVMTTHRLRAS